MLALRAAGTILLHVLELHAACMNIETEQAVTSPLGPAIYAWLMSNWQSTLLFTVSI
jgi:hypothetical protein